MKRYIYAIALCIGSTMIATGCGSSGSSSTPAAAACTTPYSGYNSGYGYGNGYSPYAANTGCVGAYGAYGSCSPCVTPNGQSGVLLNFYGQPTCGLPLISSGYNYGGQGMGTIGGQIYSCYGSSGMGYGTPGYGTYGSGYQPAPIYGGYGGYSPYYQQQPQYYYPKAGHR